MNKEAAELLSLAQKRNRSIPYLIEQDKVLQQRRELRTTIIRVLGHLWYIRRGSALDGVDNLENAIELGETGTPLVAISNHLSDSDHAIKRIMLEHEGYRNFANKMLFLAGLKMIERPLLRQFASAEKMLLIPTPFDMEDLETVLKSDGLSEEEVKVLRTLKRNYIHLSRKAKEDATASLEQDPEEILALYPESTRSRTRMVGKAHPLTNAWYNFRPGTFLVPIAVEGGEYMHPPGIKIPYKRINAKVKIGPPVPVQQLISKAEELPKGQRAQFLADYAFSFVVNLLDPKFVSADQRNYFRQLATLYSKKTMGISLLLPFKNE